MKKVLILTASFGGGHNKAANNLKNKLIEEKYDVVVVDILKEFSEKVDTVVIESYLKIINKTPDLYGILYKTSNTLTPITSPSFLTKPFATILTTKIAHLINEINPDLIIGTHVFAIGVVEYLKSKELFNGKFISIITDFITHKMYFSKYVDYYIVGSEFTKEKMSNQGIPKSKIFVYGIPIDDEFKKRKHSKKDGFNILTMFGALGMDDFSDYIIPILDIGDDVKITMVCGKNEELREKLSTKYSLFVNQGKLELIGYTNEISRLMEENQILISKPGGLTVTEAIIKNIPMVIPFYIPGQEQENLEFIIEEEIGVFAENVEILVKELKRFYKNRRKIDYMARNMEELAKNFSVKNIITLINTITNN